MLLVPEAIQQSVNGSELTHVLAFYLQYLTSFSRNPNDNSRNKDRLEYWLWLAKLAEKGKITSIFLADSYG